MFTGIVQALVKVKEVEDSPGLKHFVLEMEGDLVDDIQIGASVAINGACHTVVSIDGAYVAFDSMEETLKKTNIGSLMQGDVVNVERSAKMGDEIGGHVMSGHVFSQAEITGVKETENNHVVSFQVDPDTMKYILQKGFIGLDGCSLTVVDPDKEKGTFDVHLIPETLRVTTFGKKGKGDFVNLELDSRTQTIVDTVEEVLKSQSK